MTFFPSETSRAPRTYARWGHPRYKLIPHYINSARLAALHAGLVAVAGRLLAARRPPSKRGSFAERSSHFPVKVTRKEINTSLMSSPKLCLLM